MPQLKSGRHVALSASPYLDALAEDDPIARYAAIVALRLYAATPEALLHHMVIGYFVEGQGTPPDAPSYNSGYCVADVLAGRSDWTPDEIAEFRQFLDEPRIRPWLQAEFEAIDAAIRNNTIWDNDSHGLGGAIGLSPRQCKNIEVSASRPETMRELRYSRVTPTVADWERGTVFGETQAAPAVAPRPGIPDELRDFILMMARRPDVHSVSCQLTDMALWEGLLIEQVTRARASGKRPWDAYFLCGPDSGIGRVSKDYMGIDEVPEERRYKGTTLEEQMGGEIHIPYEGVLGADLFVYPEWRSIDPEAWLKPGAHLDAATGRKPCNHLLIEKDLGEPDCATRIGPIAGTWWLYSSKAPYKDCNPRHRDPTKEPGFIPCVPGQPLPPGFEDA